MNGLNPDRGSSPALSASVGFDTRSSRQVVWKTATALPTRVLFAHRSGETCRALIRYGRGPSAKPARPVGTAGGGFFGSSLAAQTKISSAKSSQESSWYQRNAPSFAVREIGISFIPEGTIRDVSGEASNNPSLTGGCISRILGPKTSSSMRKFSDSPETFM